MAWAMSGSEAAHTPWHTCRRGGTAVMRCLGLPIVFLAWWGRWHDQATTAYYGDAPQSLAVAEGVVLPLPQGDGDMSWGMVCLHDIFPVELLAKCVPKPNEWPARDLAAGRAELSSAPFPRPSTSVHRPTDLERSYAQNLHCLGYVVALEKI